MKRILSVFIAVIMVFSMLPAMVFTSAADAAEGTGTGSTEATDSTGATESTEATDNTGATESTEASDNTDSTESTEPAEPVVYVAEVGRVPYSTLLEAVGKAQPGDTIKLIADYVVTTPKNTEYNLPDGSTLDLGGHILNVPYMTAIFQGNATIQNGTITSRADRADYALWIGNETKDTNITLKDLTVEGGVNVYVASATLENCNVDASERNYYAVWGDPAANITIKSGTYKAGTAKPAVSKCDDATAISISGGTFSSDVTEYLAPGVDYVANADGTFSVKATVEISVVGEKPEKWYPGEQIQLSAKILPEGTEGTITWKTKSATYFTVKEGLVTYRKYSPDEKNRIVTATATLTDGSTVSGTFTLPEPINFAPLQFTVIKDGVDISSNPVIYPGDTVDVKVSWEGLTRHGLDLGSEGVTLNTYTSLSNKTTNVDAKSISTEPIEGGTRVTVNTSLSNTKYLKAANDESIYYLVVRTTVKFTTNNGVTISSDPNICLNIKNDIGGNYASRATLRVGESYELSAPHMADRGKVTWKSSKSSSISVDENGVITVNKACTDVMITAQVTVDGTTYKSYQMFSASDGPVIATLELNGNTAEVSDLRTAVKSIPANGTAVITMKDNFTYNYDLIIDSGKNVTLDLGDYTITRTVPNDFVNNYAAIWVTGDASLTINSGEKGSVVSSDGAKGLYAVNVGSVYSDPNSAKSDTAGTVTINGGNYYGNTDAVYVQMGTATINGGTFEVDNPERGYLLNCLDAKYESGDAKIIVNGGTFKGFDPKNNAAEGANTNFVDPALTSMDKGDGTFVIMEPATVNFDEFGFTVGETMSMDVTLTDDPEFTNTSGDCTVYLDILADGKWKQVGQEIKTPADAENGKYSFTFSGIPMVFLSNNMRARMISHDNEGKEYGKTLTQFGETVKEDISFANYAKALKENPQSSAELRELLNSMLNYISATQEFKGYNTDALANATLTDAEKQVTSITEYTDDDWGTYTAMKRGMTSPAPYNVKFTSSQLLMLSDKTGFRFHFTADSVEGLEMRMIIGEKTVTVNEFTSAGNGKYTAEYAGFAPTAIDTELKIAIFDTNNKKVSNTVYDSIPATAKYIAQQEKYADQRALMSSMLDYGKKATAYENKTSAN